MLTVPPNETITHAQVADVTDRPEDWVERVRNTLAEVHHDLKNPLSIISGNAQYLLELNKAAELDDHVATSIQDIEEAADRLRASLDRLAELRDEL